jgi:geranylgeranyl pyrophosphate synthase
VIADADSITSADLYPATAPPLAVLVRQSAASSSSSPLPRSTAPSRPAGAGPSPSAQVDESNDHLDLSAFPGAGSVDPFELVSAELRGINGNIKAILGIDHPVLATVAKYFFDFEGGKKIRPALVLLMAHAVNSHMARAAGTPYVNSGKLTLSAADRAAQEVAAAGVPSLGADASRTAFPAQVALPLQRRLAEITEMIHTASLLHDDVIDAADTRRGVSSVNTVFGNKLAVLAGDFLLARASICLARLRNVPVVELLSTVIEHLVKGEVMQMKTALRSSGEGAASTAAFELYLRKTYYKTGSLMANSCKAIALLGCYPDAVAEAAYKYGMHLGIAFQLVDDMLGA